MMPRPHPRTPRSAMPRMMSTIQITTSAPNSAVPFLACHWISGSSFFMKSGISDRMPKYDRIRKIVRSPPAPPAGGGGVYEPPGGGGGGVYEPPPGGGGVVGGTVG